MRPNRLNVPLSGNRSFDLRHEAVPYFTNPWHFHPELELNFVVSGSGTLFIGQHVGRFTGGEIILLGKNLPHYWKSGSAYYEADAPMSEAIIARFSESFAGEGFLGLPETAAIRTLFERAADGLRLLEPLRTEIASDMRRLLAADGFAQLMGLLNLLQKMAVSEAVEPVSPHHTSSQWLLRKNKRLGEVMAHLLKNFTEQVALKEVAELANMNEAAFCRYFKSQTGKTLTQYVTALRIRYACDLLAGGDAPVTQICYEVGFDNVSHFIQTFKKIHGQTPFGFRKNVRG